MQNANKLKEKTQNSFIMEHRNYDQAADEYISGLLQVRNQIPEEVKFDIVSAYSFAVQNESARELQLLSRLSLTAAVLVTPPSISKTASPGFSLTSPF